jgi:hypothetical protein
MDVDGAGPSGAPLRIDHHHSNVAVQKRGVPFVPSANLQAAVRTLQLAAEALPQPPVPAEGEGEQEGKRKKMPEVLNEPLSHVAVLAHQVSRNHFQPRAKRFPRRMIRSLAILYA